MNIKIISPGDYELKSYRQEKRKMKLILKNNLAELREKQGFSQTELGEKVGVSRQSISSIERDEYRPSVYLALKLADVLGVSVNEIFSLGDGK